MKGGGERTKVRRENDGGIREKGGKEKGEDIDVKKGGLES